jgi:hypothetical protein
MLECDCENARTEMARKRVQSIVGKKIARVEMNPSVEGEHHDRRTMHRPVIVLEDGSRVVFVVEEHPIGAEYGVNLIVVRPD